MKFVTTTLLLVAFRSSSLVCAKRLVLFAGPHKSASSSVEEFFYEYADEFDRDNENHKEIFGLRFWRWPHVDSTLATAAEPEQPHKIFKHLVTDPDNEPLQKEILDGISKAWNEIQSGVILGTEEFDQVGPYAEYDAIAAMKKVIAHVQAKDVTIVINYRAPRVDQWASIWKHDETKTSYEDFLCQSNNYDHRIKLLGTQMNPLQAAQVFLDAGLGKVVLIDMGGVEKLGTDVAHVIACEVVDGKCDDGWLRNHADQVKTGMEGDRDFTGLTDEEAGMADALFEFRDCLYEPALASNPKFQILYKDSLWKDCDPALTDIYKSLQDPAIIFGALLNQMECPVGEDMKKNMISIEQVFAGDFSSVESMSKSGNSGGMFYEAVLFPLLLLGAFGYQVFTMYNSRRNGDAAAVNAPKERQAAVMEAEMSAVMTGSDVDAEYGDVDGDDGLGDGLDGGVERLQLS